MIHLNEYGGYKVGDLVVVLEKPTCSSSMAGQAALCPTVDFPYRGIVRDIAVSEPSDQYFSQVAVKIDGRCFVLTNFDKTTHPVFRGLIETNNIMHDRQFQDEERRKHIEKNLKPGDTVTVKYTQHEHGIATDYRPVANFRVWPRNQAEYDAYIKLTGNPIPPAPKSFRGTNRTDPNQQPGFFGRADKPSPLNLVKQDKVVKEPTPEPTVKNLLCKELQKQFKSGTFYQHFRGAPYRGTAAGEWMGEVLFVAVSILSKDDVFCKKTGRDNAYKRLKSGWGVPYRFNPMYWPEGTTREGFFREMAKKTMAIYCEDTDTLPSIK